MLKLKTKHLKTGEELDTPEIRGLIDFAVELKKDRNEGRLHSFLLGKNLALIFDKPSLRTRFSFTIAMTELGGTSVESVPAARKQEEPEDLARVLAGYCHALMIRTHDDRVIERMAAVSPVPILNGLSECHHPCQILSDLMTLQEVFGSLKDITLSYIGDGNNILHSLLLLAPRVGVNVHYSCPKGYSPRPEILSNALKRANERGNGRILSFDSPEQAMTHANAVYTDVWTSMGFEDNREEREKSFSGYQVNEKLMQGAAPGAVVMHCLPMERGKEISQGLPDSACSVIFRQSENRLHLQKALLVGLLSRHRNENEATANGTRDFA